MQTNTSNHNQLEQATFGTGCFWCTEAIFKKLKGVQSVLPGYAGGHVENPTYEQVCGKDTGHAEVVQIAFDPSQISFEDLLEVFWRVHNPTTPDRQGNDIGPQYRSVIFYHNAHQQDLAIRSREEVENTDLWPDPIVTEISPFTRFYPAEDYHKNYFERVGDRNPYCTMVVSPKVNKFMKDFKEKLQIP